VIPFTCGWPHQKRIAGQTELAGVLGPWMRRARYRHGHGSGGFKKPYAVSLQVNEFGLVMLACTGRVLALSLPHALARLPCWLPRRRGDYVFCAKDTPWAASWFGWVEFWIIRMRLDRRMARLTESLHAVLKHPEPAGPAGLPDGAAGHHRRSDRALACQCPRTAWAECSRWW